MSPAHSLSRRGVLTGGGLVVAFALTPRAAGEGKAGLGGGAQNGKPSGEDGLQGSLGKNPLLDSWIRVAPDGVITVFTGKAELGQGIKTALLQLAAEELDVAPARLKLVTADTALTPNEGYTAGSHSMQDSGSAIMNAAANVRVLLAQAAAQRWGLPAVGLRTSGDGALVAPDGRRAGYGELAAGLSLHVQARPDVPTRSLTAPRLVGRDLPRVDIPGKLTGAPAYIQDLRLPGMLHARVVRTPAEGGVLELDALEAVARMLGVVRLVRNGRFTAVVAERQWIAIQAMQRLQQRGSRPVAPAIEISDPLARLVGQPAQDIVVFDRLGPTRPAARTIEARYSRPWLMHGSIGPSCALALYRDGALTVWTHAQGVYPLRGAIAELVGLAPDRVRCIHVEGAGCYGHNGADDAAADAALAAMAVPGRPVRLQWTREQEHGWEPLGPTMLVQARASLDAATRICDWRYEVWSNTHATRPAKPGGLLAGREVESPFPLPEAKPLPLPEGGGDRNAVPLYAVPSGRAVYHFLPRAELRPSALRSLGAHMNVFAIESLMDELALAAGADPVAFRLAHLDDPRTREAIQACAADFAWSRRPRGDGRRGCGFAFARYKNLASWCAVAMEVEVEHETGGVAVRRVRAVVDAGEAVNPDGVRNQIEGAIVQSLSWTGIEAVVVDGGRASFDWSTYPIARFADVPLAVQVRVMHRPGQPFLGAGEAGQGPAAAALANAIADATGVRMRDMPLAGAALKAKLGV